MGFFWFVSHLPGIVGFVTRPLRLVGFVPGLLKVLQFVPHLLGISDFVARLLELMGFVPGLLRASRLISDHPGSLDFIQDPLSSRVPPVTFTGTMFCVVNA